MVYRNTCGLEVPSPDGRQHQRWLRTAGLGSCDNLSSKQLFANQLEMVVADREEKIAEIATSITNTDSNIRKKEHGKKETSTRSWRELEQMKWSQWVGNWRSSSSRFQRGGLVYVCLFIRTEQSCHRCPKLTILIITKVTSYVQALNDKM